MHSCSGGCPDPDSDPGPNLARPSASSSSSASMESGCTAPVRCVRRRAARPGCHHTAHGARPRPVRVRNRGTTHRCCVCASICHALSRLAHPHAPLAAVEPLVAGLDALDEMKARYLVITPIARGDEGTLPSYHPYSSRR
eukprot:scaffold20669_cov49-Phaeocystis_antarctica.AAC.3